MPCCCAKSLSRVCLFATPWTVARQAPLSMGFSRQECWNGLPFFTPGDLPNPGIEPRSMATHSSILVRKIPWTEEPGGLQSTGSQRVGHEWATSHTHTHTHSLIAGRFFTNWATREVRKWYYMRFSAEQENKSSKDKKQCSLTAPHNHNLGKRDWGSLPHRLGEAQVLGFFSWPLITGIGIMSFSKKN